MEGELFTTGADLKQEVGAFIANCDQWFETDNGETDVERITQIPTGHGNFGEYLYRIGAERTAKCRVFNTDVNYVQHVQQDCEQFAEQL